MKHLSLILTLFFSTMFASPAYADWEKVGVDDTGTIYVDLDRMRIKGGYVYYWELYDFDFRMMTNGGGEELPPQAATMNAKKHSATLDFITWFTSTLHGLSQNI